MTYRLRNILIAVALALVAAMLTSFYVTNYQRNVQRGEEDVKVFVAARDIPAGTSGSALLKSPLLTEKTVERRNVVPGAISSASQVEGLVATDRIYAGEQVTSRRFTTPAQRGPRAQLTGTLRGIAVSGDPQQLLAGTLREGDRVDVVASLEHPPQSGVYYSRLVLRDILVLRAPSGGVGAEKLTGGGSLGAVTTMLALTDAQSSKLFWAMKNGNGWHLELRPVTDAADSPENVESSGTMVREGAKPAHLGEVARDSRPLAEGGND